MEYSYTPPKRVMPEKSALGPMEQEIYNVMDLIVAELESDPLTCAGFDSSIVERAITIRNDYKGSGAKPYAFKYHPNGGK